MLDYEGEMKSILNCLLETQLVWSEFVLFHINFRLPPNEMALYPNWLILYVLRIVIPMLMLGLVALKILIKNGRDLQRAFDIDLTPSFYSKVPIISTIRLAESAVQS